MAIVLIFMLFLSVCKGNLPPNTCPNGGEGRSLFFMSVGFSGTQGKYIEPTSDLCLCEKSISCNLPLNCLQNCTYNSDTIYRVISQTDVYGILGNGSLGEMFNTLKDEHLGLEYVASVYFDVTGKSFIGLGNPSSSDIVVNITLPDINNYTQRECMNKTITVNLNSYEATTLDFNCDITGAHISASGNIIAYAASFSSLEQNTASNLQFMVEQLIPVDQWGTRYAVVPYGKNAYGDIISIVASQPHTFVHISGYDHVIIPNKYESIRRRIDGKKPVTIRSSKPVSVTQFVLNAAHKSAMVINVPITLNTDYDALNHDSGFNHSYMNITYEPENDNNAPLTHFFAHRGDSSPPSGIFGCSLYRDGSRFGGTFCGFNQTEDSNVRHWPLMVPGDGIDNDRDGQTDEDDCYASIWDDSSNPYLSPLGAFDCKSNVAASSVREIFILPRFDNIPSKVRCRIEPQTSITDIMYWYNSTATRQWQPQTRVENWYLFENIPDGKPLIIKARSSQKLSLMCNFVCDSVDPCSNSFLVPPVSNLGTEYTTMFPPCYSGSMCHNQCVASNVFNSTSVSYVHGAEYRKYPLRQHLVQQPLHNIIDGSYIVANYPVAIMCASFTTNNYLIHFLPPASMGGTEYKIIKTNDLQNEKLFFVATDGNTVVNFSGNEYQALGSFRQHFLLENAGEQYTVELALDNSDFTYSFSSSKPVHVIAEFKQNSSTENVDATPFSADGYNFVYLPPVYNILAPTDETSISQTASDVTYYHLSKSGWPHRSNIQGQRAKPSIDRNQIPGDGIDNDKDGLTDEEYCGFIVEENPSEVVTLHDIDLDGSYNEDCKGCQGGQQLTEFLICMECDFGTYRENQSKIDKCLSCGENYTTFEQGSFTMDQCVPACIEGRELRGRVCEPCLIGYFKSVSANDTSLNNTDRFFCKRCPDRLTTYDVGTITENCIVHCKEGKELTDQGTCQACGIGFYKTESSTNLSIPSDKRWNCTICENNKTTIENGSLHESNCIDNCVEGMFLNGTICSPCPVGFYKNTSSMDYSLSSHLRWNCTQCEDGNTTFSIGSRKCLGHCEEGEGLTDQGTCEPCGIGFYKPMSSQRLSVPLDKRWNCTMCENNKTTIEKGSVQQSKCIDNCAEGMFLNGTICSPCPVGFYKNTSSLDHSLSSHLRWNCTQCEDGKTTFSIRGRECLDHCRNGQYLKDGTCTPCEIGFYKNTSSEDESLPESLKWNCTACPAGETTNSTGAENCIKTCPIGKEYNKTTTNCDPCRLGTYKNVSGSHINCYHCPENYTTRHTGAVSFQDCKLADCKCPCNRVNEVKNYTSSELATVIAEMKEELTVNKAQLSASVRKKISVMDRRPSVQYIGSFGVLLITGVMAFLIGIDFFTLKEHLKMFFKNLKSIF